MWVTLRVELTKTELAKFEDFYSTNQRYLRHGNYADSDRLDALKPWIDKRWEKYQAWKKAMGYN